MLMTGSLIQKRVAAVHGDADRYWDNEGVKSSGSYSGGLPGSGAAHKSGPDGFKTAGRARVAAAEAVSSLPFPCLMRSSSSSSCLDFRATRLLAAVRALP